MTTDSGTSLFRSEYERELEDWLRRRFRYFCTTLLVLGAIDLAGTLVLVSDMQPAALATLTVGKALALIILAHTLLRRDWTGAHRKDVLSATTRLILVVGAITLLSNLSVRLIDTNADPSLILPLFFWHLASCAFLPWTPRESLRPFVPLLLLWAVLVLVIPAGADLVDRVLRIVFGPAILLPGLMIASLRLHQHIRQFRTRMVGRHFTSLRREMSRARSIHQSMFPSPYDDGYVCFEYLYKPMRELGGDFVHLHIGAEGLVHLTLLDVTGHGLAAALTVNRLYGEMERIRAETPRAEAGEVLTLLNRYFNLTLIRHNVYATATCLTVDPYGGELRWASAGHPPGFLRGVNGVMRDLGPTAIMLGAVDDQAFDPAPAAVELTPGDTLVLFTDGLIEARDRAGRQFGLDRVRELMRLQPPPAHWPGFIDSAVSRHSAGRPDDDILIATVALRGLRGQPRTVAAATATAAATGSP